MSLSPHDIVFPPVKYTGNSNIALKILKLAKQPISSHPSKIFNLSFSSGIFPERIKTAKVT